MVVTSEDQNHKIHFLKVNSETEVSERDNNYKNTVTVVTLCFLHCIFALNFFLSGTSLLTAASEDIEPLVTGGQGGFAGGNFPP